MKFFFFIFTISGLLTFAVGCNRDSEIQRNDIQREEAMDADDIRETDTYNRSVPVENEEEMDMNRDDVMEDDTK